MAHSTFKDKRRRALNLREAQVDTVLPEHFGALYPKFITLLEKYYDWQNDQNATELLDHLFAARDINETDITLLSYIEDELLLGDAYFEGFGETEAEKRAAANFSNTLFRSKGSKFAIEWFFRSFYGVDATVEYPKENIFNLNDAQSQIGPNSLRFLTDDKLYQTWALLVKTSIPISQWNDIFKLFSHPAGMYLGSEVLISEANSTPLATQTAGADSAAESYTSLTYDLSVGIEQDSEGAEFNFTSTRLTGVGALDNYDALFYYVDHITTDNDDFVTAPPTSIDTQFFPVAPSGSDAIGTFTLLTLRDSDETEGQESFRVVVVDRQGTIQDSATILLDDAKSIYTLEVDSDNPYEGETLNFTITGADSNPPNQTLNYYINPTGVSPIDPATDFVDSAPVLGTPANIKVVNQNATFALTLDVDNDLEGDETFQVVARLGSIVKATSPTITVKNFTPTLGVATAATHTEGDDITFTVTCNDFDVGETVNWSITGGLATDDRVPIVSGSFELTGTTTEFVLPTELTNTAEGNVSGTFTVTNNNYAIPLSANTGFTVIDAAREVFITMNPAAASEGETVTFSISGTNIADGDYYFYLEDIDTDNADFTSRPTNGSPETITISGNSGTSGNVIFASNADPTDEDFRAKLYSDAGLTILVAEDVFTIAISGYELTADPASGDEGTTHTMTFTGPIGVYYYWVDGAGVTSGDFTSGYAPSSARNSLNNTTGSIDFDITTAADGQFDTETGFNVNVSTGTSSGAIESLFVTVADTSAPSFSVSAPDVIEGNTQTVSITSSNLTGTQIVYVEITGAATSKFSTTQGTLSFSGNETKTIDFATIAASDVYSGQQAGTVTVARDDYASGTGTSLNTDTFFWRDAAATATLSASDTTPDEGDTITLSVTGTNLADGTYYIKETSMATNTTNGLSSSGTAVINLSDTTGIAIGMRTDNVLAAGTVTFVGSSTVTMSQNLSGNISSGTVINFSPQNIRDDITSGAASSITIASNVSTSTYNVVFASNDDVIDDTLTFGLYSDEARDTLLDTVTVTVTDTTPTADVNAPDLSAINSMSPTFGTPVYSLFRFVSDNETITNPSGLETPQIRTRGSFNQNAFYINDVGDWLTGTANFNSSEYEIYFSTPVTQTNFQDPDGYVGTFDQWQSLEFSRVAGIFVNEDPGDIITSSVTIAYQIREIANPTTNIDSGTLTCTATYDAS